MGFSSAWNYRYRAANSSRLKCIFYTGVASVPLINVGLTDTVFLMSYSLARTGGAIQWVVMERETKGMSGYLRRRPHEHLLR
jgi:hypothetical protein